MSLLRRWAPIALGVLVAGFAALGYAQIAPGIANPNADLRATLVQPPAGEVVPAHLDDGRPVFVVKSDGGDLAVLDAQSTHVPSGMGHLLAWCPTDGHFEDLFGGSTFASNGARLGGPAPSGLQSYGLQPVAGRTELVGVTTVTRAVAGPEPGTAQPPAGCTQPWLVHEPLHEEVFDPSVAIDQEPLEWVWLDGTLSLRDDESVLLCDVRAPDCGTFAATAGIGSAYFAVGPRERTGLFIGRVRDDAIDGLIAVPDIEEIQ